MIFGKTMIANTEKKHKMRQPPFTFSAFQTGLNTHPLTISPDWHTLETFSVITQRSSPQALRNDTKKGWEEDHPACSSI